MNCKFVAVVLSMLGMAVLARPPHPEEASDLVDISSQFPSQLYGAPSSEVFVHDGSRRKSIEAENTKAFARFLPKLSEAITEGDLPPMERVRQIALSVLPLARDMVVNRELNVEHRDLQYYLEQQDAAEQFVPALLAFVSDIVKKTSEDKDKKDYGHEE